MKLEIFLPDGLQEQQHEIRYFLEQMLVKLNVNRHKGWIDGDVNNYVFLRRLAGEIGELAEALEKESQHAVCMEAADVANFGLLIGLYNLSKNRGQYDEERSIITNYLKAYNEIAQRAQMVCGPDNTEAVSSGTQLQSDPTDEVASGQTQSPIGMGSVRSI